MVSHLAIGAIAVARDLPNSVKGSQLLTGMVLLHSDWQRDSGHKA